MALPIWRRSQIRCLDTPAGPGLGSGPHRRFQHAALHDDPTSLQDPPGSMLCGHLGGCCCCRKAGLAPGVNAVMQPSQKWFRPVAALGSEQAMPQLMRLGLALRQQPSPSASKPAVVWYQGTCGRRPYLANVLTFCKLVQGSVQTCVYESLQPHRPGSGRTIPQPTRVDEEWPSPSHAIALPRALPILIAYGACT